MFDLIFLWVSFTRQCIRLLVLKSEEAERDDYYCSDPFI
ncbi:hypothetical protein C1752_07874 [Acaryochloris thomasi RCC1774]|uniref:Uncharacterized protein n=1 Tax=Acaryochloris thomasi RCC1774 TaxID=1764569 RepID=A0A2W1JB09_9CYAN|nr:hypothetical protein C1752_07874 [Acaryochloris thomasi RCC1774]